MSIQIDGNGFINGYQRVNASVGSAGPTWFRNKFLNATFIFNHRSSGTTLAANTYGLDRWKSGTSGCTYSSTAVANMNQLTISAGTLLQIVESWNIEGGTYVLSWTGTAQARVNGGAYGSSGMTFSLPANTNATIEFNTGTLYQPQLEIGTMPTAFEQRLISIERPMLYRYFYTLVGAPAQVVYRMITSGSYAGSQPMLIQFPQQLRGVPNVIVYTDSARSNPGNVMKNGTTVTPIANAIVTSVSSTGYQYWANSAFAVGDYASFFLDFDAEI